MRKVELLSPAGGYETMVGAFNAGADAVYLGGSKFGARAYADNFDRDQVLDAIVYAHLHGKKIYMTVNTLVKEGEFSDVYDFMVPYAEKNLDGVIVQDLGVARLIRQEFPHIELHASTQQTITGVYGARLLKERGYTRVVPARELSLSEMKAIRQEADIEVEAFIHGAMCYCYSGACLFSSVVGGRSGNRGRCAQPCRLPYGLGAGDSEKYPLSLKDMSTIGIIPELIQAGIDSFKIEGRMKKPEYSAGVTALYRKYIDKYYADPNGDYRVSDEDLETLRNLYQRTGISEGYYHRHNDKSMVTVLSPAYNATSEDILKSVHDKYLGSTLKHSCDMYCELITGQKAKLTMSVWKGEDFFYEEVYGDEVQAASKRPMDEDSIRKQLAKLGGTVYEAGNIDITIDDGGSGTGIFVAVSALNELRRELVSKMDENLLPKNEFTTAPVEHFTDYDSYKASDKKNTLQVLVSTKEQLDTVLYYDMSSGLVNKIFVDSNLFLSTDDKTRAAMAAFKKGNDSTSLYVALPYITREEKWDGTKEVQRVMDALSGSSFDGILVRNLEQLGYLKAHGYAGYVTLDYGVYNWNKESVLELLDIAMTSKDNDGLFIDEISAPYELNFREASDLVAALKQKVDIPVAYNIYGHIPMMISAGCIKKTTASCSGRMNELYSENVSIVDRMNNKMTVTCNCRHCYNVIWNAYPTSLHGSLDKITGRDLFDDLRIDFTIEDAGRCRQILDYYTGRISGGSHIDIFGDKGFTTGHYKRGVE
ncbi:peptidase U32 family protein [Butyrivibrio sp. CB08]|uniref:peptidase U32 family protein n=1 Tax=Butyrivibrio sp. CB08 TaxID=2364879 RepID=UPI001314003B|nr:U32 family peptidase [Butyrivibrio sp. CB08]